GDSRVCRKRADGKFQGGVVGGGHGVRVSLNTKIRDSGGLGFRRIFLYDLTITLQISEDSGHAGSESPPRRRG
ncbi:hypothetical protein KK062_27385, partial [Fulvivirgaceae bacterium PWU5]